MRFVIKQKLFSFRSRYMIRDEQEREVYAVEGKFFSWFKKLRISDMQGRKLAYLRQRFAFLRPLFEVIREGQPTVTIRKRFWPMWPPRLDVTVEGGGPALSVAGSYWGHEYTIGSGGKTIATISKRWFTWADTYGVQVEPGVDPVLVLSIAIVMDSIFHEQRAAANSSSS